MKQLIKRYLRKCPVIYSSAKRIHRIFYRLFTQYLKPYVFGTRLEERYWAKCPPSISAETWSTREHPHRTFLVEQITTFSPIHTILEVGCNSGPNLYLLAKKFPDAELRGIDINPYAVKDGNAWIKKEGISNVRLSVGKADALESFQDNYFDIVFTDAVLMYIARDKIKKVIKELIRITRKALLLMEWHCFESKSNPLGFYIGQWVRDYVALSKKCYPEGKVRAIKMPEHLWPDKNWQRYGGIVSLEK